MAREDASRTIGKAKREAHKAKREARPWVIALARLGYAAKGVVYLLIAWLALNAAQGAGAANVDKHRALLTIITQPFGKVVLAVIALGLVGYGLWRIIQAIEDPENVGIAKRVAYAIIGIVYFSLAAYAVRLVMGSGATGSDATAQRDITARIMSLPFGTWIVGLAGLAVIGLGCFQLYSAYKAKFEKSFKMSEMDANLRRRMIQLGRAGNAAIGIVSLMLGVFLVRAAQTHDPNQAGGLGEALQALASQPYGSWILFAVALGLAAYGLYAIALARYRRIYF